MRTMKCWCRVRPTRFSNFWRGWSWRGWSSIRWSHHDGWAIDLEALGRAIGERTRAIVLVNPNNPTGSFVKRGELERLVELAAESSIALISDEVFSDYAFGPDAERVAESPRRRVEGGADVRLWWRVIETGGAAADEAGVDRDRRAGGATRGGGGEAGADRGHGIFRWELPGAIRTCRFCSVAARERAAADYCARKGEPGGARGGRRETHAGAGSQGVGGWQAATLRVPQTKTEEQWCLELLEQDGEAACSARIFLHDFESEAFLVLSLADAGGHVL